MTYYLSFLSTEMGQLSQNYSAKPFFSETVYEIQIYIPSNNSEGKGKDQILFYESVYISNIIVMLHEHDDISNHHKMKCSLNSLFRLTYKKFNVPLLAPCGFTNAPLLTLYEGNPSVTCGFPSQRASNTWIPLTYRFPSQRASSVESLSMSWRHHEMDSGNGSTISHGWHLYWKSDIWDLAVSFKFSWPGKYWWFLGKRLHWHLTY